MQQFEELGFKLLRRLFKKLWANFVKFWEGLSLGTRNNWLDFVGNVDLNPDPGVF